MGPTEPAAPAAPFIMKMLSALMSMPSVIPHSNRSIDWFFIERHPARISILTVDLIVDTGLGVSYQNVQLRLRALREVAGVRALCQHDCMAVAKAIAIARV